MKWILSISLIILCTCQVTFAENKSNGQGRDINLTIGVGIGYGDYFYDDDYVTPGNTVDSFDNQRTAAYVLIGYEINPYLGLELTLTRPFVDITVNEPNGKSGEYKMKSTVFGLSLKPTLPVSDKLSVYTLLGLGYATHRDVVVDNKTVVEDFTGTVFMTGAGLQYKFNPRWQTRLFSTYSTSTGNQPPSLFIGLAGAYTLHLDPDKPNMGGPTSTYKFPKHQVSLDFFNDELFHYDFPPSLPVFWSGKVKFQQGMMLQYQRLFVHTKKYISIHWGFNASYLLSREDSEDVYAISAFPAFYFWLLHNPLCDIYYSYIVAGPTYLSRVQIDGVDTGEHFTFFDAMKLGFIAGRSKRLSFGLSIAHYSNGRLFPENPGLSIPLSISLGYIF